MLRSRNVLYVFPSISSSYSPLSRFAVLVVLGLQIQGERGQSLITVKRKYIVLRPFSVLDDAGNQMMIHSNEVLAQLPDDLWVKGQVGHLKFRALETVFTASTVLKT